MFTIKDFKTGDFITYRNGGVRQFLNTPRGGMLVSKTRYCEIEDFNSDLTMNGAFEHLSIVKVERPKDNRGYMFSTHKDSFHCYDVVFERQEKHTMILDGEEVRLTQEGYREIQERYVK